MAKQPAEFIWFNGEIIPWQQATVHVMTHAIHYGSSVFEGVRAYNTPDQGHPASLGFTITIDGCLTQPRSIE